MSNLAEKTESNISTLPQVSNQYDQMISLAIDKNADIEKLEKLMQMKERWEANEARKAFTDALSRFRGDCPPIPKNIHVKYGNTEYYHEDLDTIQKVISKPLSECGLSYTFGTGSENGVITVTCRITHKDGHFEETSLPSPADKSGGKNDIQGIGSAITYLQRYTLKAMLGLSAGVDNDAVTSEQMIQKPLDDRFTGFLMTNNAVGMYLLHKEYLNGQTNFDLDDENGKAWTQLFSNLPEGFKGKAKEQAHRLIEQGENDLLNIIASIEAQDPATVELVDFMDRESKKLLAKELGTDLSNTLGDLVKKAG